MSQIAWSFLVGEILEVMSQYGITPYYPSPTLTTIRDQWKELKKMGKNNVRKTQEEFVSIMKNLHPNIQVLGEYISNKTHINLKCLKDGHEWSAKPDNLLQMKGCPVCANKKVLKGINDLSTTHKWIIPLLADINDGFIYTAGSGKKIRFKCPSCGEITKLTTIKDIVNHGLNCCICGDKASLPNKIMYNLLQQLHIDFESEIQFDWCRFTINNEDRYGIYDFYFELNSKKYIVEMDGKFHFIDNNMSGQTKEESKEIDIKKEEKAKIQDIEVVRINCIESEFNKIKEGILSSILSTLFDLSCINWNIIFVNCSTSRIYKTCELWNSGIKEPIKIAKIIKVSHSSILKDLKHGKILGICDYTPEISREIHKDKTKQSIRNAICKSVVCVNTGEIFTAMIDASVRYGNGKKLNIDACCNGTRNYAGTLDNGVHLKWMYYDKYIMCSDEDIINYLFQEKENPRNKKVICLNNLQVFNSIKEASEILNSNRIHISHCCNGERKTCGIDMINKERLRWMFYDKYLLLNNELGHCEKSVAFIM